MLRQEQISEIKAMYRESKNKKRQIGILAQLYACSNEEIREVLGLNTLGQQIETNIAKPEQNQLVKEERPVSTICQSGKTVDIWSEEEKEENKSSISKALQSLLDEFDENEAKMRELMGKMVPLAEEYKEIELRQQELASFIENFCRIREKKHT